MGLSSVFQQYLPGNIRSQPGMIEFADGVGCLLDGFSTAIDVMKYYNDPSQIASQFLDSLGAMFGLVFPKGVPDYTKQIEIRDAVQSYRLTGTMNALLRIFRLIGWTVTVDQMWIVYPGLIGPIDNNTFIFGNEFTASNGLLYVNLYDDLGDTYDNITIYGVPYPNLLQGVMCRLPYLRITIDSQDYGNLTQSYVDPTTGITYSYTLSEQFNIAQQTVNYFLNEARPANVVIYDLNTFFTLTENDFPNAQNIDSATFTPTALGIYGEGAIYGVGLDLVNFGVVYKELQYGTDIEIDPSPPTVITTRTYASGITGVQDDIQTRGSAIFEIVSGPSNVSIEIQSSVSARSQIEQGTATWTSLVTLPVATPFPYSVNLTDIRAVRLNIIGGSTNAETITQVTHL